MAISISAATASMPMTAHAPSVHLPVVNEFQQLLYRDDLANVFFNTNEFSETCSYYHSSLGVWQSYSVLFDDPSADVSLLGDAEFNTNRPQIQASEAVFVHRPLKNDRCRVRGKTYIVEDVVSDGVGVTTVYLRLK